MGERTERGGGYRRVVLTKKEKKSGVVVAVMVMVGEKKAKLFGRYEDAGGIYKAACGQEIHRERRRNWERGESLRARCSAQIFRLLKSREMSACNSH